MADLGGGGADPAYAPPKIRKKKLEKKVKKKVKKKKFC